jgi:hypothetical protein
MTYENELLSYDTYLFRFIHIFLEPIPTYSFQTILSASLVDTKQQKDQRGMEFNLNPSIELTKNFTERVKLAINYSYVSNSSKDENYKYHRQIIGTNLNYSF